MHNIDSFAFNERVKDMKNGKKAIYNYQRKIFQGLAV